MRPRSPIPSEPFIDPADLRRHDDEERVERIWQRLDADLTGVSRARGPSLVSSIDRPRSRALLAVAFAATFAAFGGGVLVGKSNTRRAPSASVDPLSAFPAPDRSLVEVLAAGSQTSSFPLLGGGRLTLSPGSTVEVERAGTAMTLSLLQGEASLDSATKGFTVAAGEARINTQAGSVLTIRRNADDVDVKVDEGSVSVSSSDGQATVGKSEHKVLPIHVAVAARALDADAKARDRALPFQSRRPGKPQSVTKPAAVAEWFTHYPADEKGALASLRKLGVAQAIDGAHGAAELMAIAELMGRGGQDVGAEIRALDRLVSAFPGDQRASLAADRLARIYDARGDAARAKEFRDKVQPLAEKATVGSDALICDLIRREPDKTRAALSAKEYLANYPDGECREEFERLVQSSSRPAALATPGDTPDAGAGSAPVPASGAPLK